MDTRVTEYFHSGADAFDAIYTGRKGRLARLMDRVFRRDMQARFHATMQACGEVNGKRVLDVGCGSGRYAIALARRGARVTGVDSAAAMIAMAGRIAGESGVADRCLFKAGEFLSLPAERGYDIILAIGLFDYIADPAPYLARMREGGEILVATFPRAWTWRAPVRKLRLALAGCPVHFYTRRRVYRLFRENGWHRVELSRIGKLHFVVAVAPGGR